MNSLYRSNILSTVREQHLLHEVSLELTYHCNLDCFYCYNDREKPGQPLSLQQYETLLEDMAEMQVLHLMLTGGEPMVHPDFYAIGRKAKSLGFVTRLRTNGHGLNRKQAERLRDEVDPIAVEVSLHGATSDVHDRQTRVAGSFDQLVANLQTAKEVGLRCSVVSTPTAWNEHQIECMYALCDSLGVPLRFQGPVSPRDNGDLTPLQIQPSDKAWRAISTVKQSKRVRSPVVIASDYPEEPIAEPTATAATCSVGTTGVDIDPYGNVQACMHLQESAGNLHVHSIHDIWHNSPLFSRARERAQDAAQQFKGQQASQLGAPLYCLAVEENIKKGQSGCTTCNGAC